MTKTYLYQKLLSNKGNREIDTEIFLRMFQNLSIQKYFFDLEK
jgi:hypothetical protein